jgi:PD-(D/E)XK nuclease superfamily
MHIMSKLLIFLGPNASLSFITLRYHRSLSRSVWSRSFSVAEKIIGMEGGVADGDDDSQTLVLPGQISYPKNLSPSSIMEFQKCPQSFLFQYLLGMKQPTNPTLVKGTMCHSALEQIFDLEPKDRTLLNLENLFRKEWSKQKVETEEYQNLFWSEELGKWDINAERTWGLSGLNLLGNYYALEDPRKITQPNPFRRETWVYIQLPARYSSVSASRPTTFVVRGIIDRIDMIRHPVDKQVCLRLVDYKSGKTPDLKYSAKMNEKIAEESFFQLKMYAFMWRETKNPTPNMDIRGLRLLHLTSQDGSAKYLDYDLGSPMERTQILNDVRENVINTWEQICDLVDTQDPLQFHGCNRSFCWCHTCRPRFIPGSVWSPTEN